jgi:hypothetical protein
LIFLSIGIPMNKISTIVTCLLICFFAAPAFCQDPDPCLKLKDTAASITQFTRESIFVSALNSIRRVAVDGNEHCVGFGRDAGNNIVFTITKGGATSGKVPAVPNAFADLHNHTNDLPPDAGDFFGLADLYATNSLYTRRFVLTRNGIQYALVITDSAALRAFLRRHPPQPPAYPGGPKGFTVSITDEGREMKYRYACTDEMVMAFILEKYAMGVSLFRQDSKGRYRKLITIITSKGGQKAFSMEICP